MERLVPTIIVLTVVTVLFVAFHSVTGFLIQRKRRKHLDPSLPVEIWFLYSEIVHAMVHRADTTAGAVFHNWTKIPNIPKVCGPDNPLVMVCHPQTRWAVYMPKSALKLDDLPVMTIQEFHQKLSEADTALKNYQEALNEVRALLEKLS